MWRTEWCPRTHGSTIFIAAAVQPTRLAKSRLNQPTAGPALIQVRARAQAEAPYIPHNLLIPGPL